MIYFRVLLNKTLESTFLVDIKGFHIHTFFYAQRALRVTWSLKTNVIRLHILKPFYANRILMRSVCSFLDIIEKHMLTKDAYTVM